MVKMKYKTETHLHCEESNHCSEVPAEEMVKHYKKLGYHTLIVTPHYSRAYLGTITPDWDMRVDYLLFGYQKAKKMGKKLGINIILAIELTSNVNRCDYLIYGITEEFLRTNTGLYDIELDELVKLCKLNDFLLIQAHPFRKGHEPGELKYQMGIEVFNGRHVLDAKNNLAKKYAEANDLTQLSGTDFHDYLDHKGGIITNQEIKNIQEFKNVIRKKQYQLIIPN